MRKILLVSGDSFTDPHHHSHAYPNLYFPWKRWPELLAEKLDMDIINLGRSGSGNKYIYSSLHDFIIKHPKKYNGKIYYDKYNNYQDRIGLVISAWSQSFRDDYQLYSYGQWKNTRVKQLGDLINWVEESLRYYVGLQTLCEHKNLPHMQFQMIPLYLDFLRGLGPTQAEIVHGGVPKDDTESGWYTNIYQGDKERDEQVIFERILEYDKIINHSNFVGWPIARELGGFPLNMKLFHTPEFESDCVISETDQHPNEKGHIKIAEYLFNHYKDYIQ